MKHLPNSSLKAVSLTNHALSKIAAPELFADIDLGKREPEQIRRMQADLFGPRSSGRSRNLHVRSILVQLLEEACASGNVFGNKQVRRSVKTVSEFLVRGPSTEKFEISVCIYENLSAKRFEAIVAPAISKYLESMKDKAGKLTLSIDDLAFEVPDEKQELALISRVSHIVSLAAAYGLNELFLNGVNCSQIGSALSSDAACHIGLLSLQDCRGLPPNWTSPTLRSLRISWPGGDDIEAAVNLVTAYELICGCVNTLEHLVLQNIERFGNTGASVSIMPIVSRNKITLPVLRHLRVADGSTGVPYVLSTITKHFELPGLLKLVLETEDILACELQESLRQMPALRRLELEEGRMFGKAVPECNAFSVTADICKDRRIELSLTVSSLRCDTKEQMNSELSRLRILADFVRSFSISLSSVAYLASADCPIIALPHLRSLGLCITDCADQAAVVNDVTTFLRLLAAPNLLSLNFTAFTKGELSLLDQLVKLLQTRHFSRLETLDGACMASPNAPANVFRQHETAFQTSIAALGIDAQAFRFIDRSTLLGLADEDEEIEKDEWDDGNEDHSAMLDDNEGQVQIDASDDAWTDDEGYNDDMQDADAE